VFEHLLHGCLKNFEWEDQSYQVCYISYLDSSGSHSAILVTIVIILVATVLYWRLQCYIELLYRILHGTPVTEHPTVLSKLK